MDPSMPHSCKNMPYNMRLVGNPNWRASRFLKESLRHLCQREALTAKSFTIAYSIMILIGGATGPAHRLVMKSNTYFLFILCHLLYVKLHRQPNSHVCRTSVHRSEVLLAIVVQAKSRGFQLVSEVVFYV